MTERASRLYEPRIESLATYEARTNRQSEVLGFPLEAGHLETLLIASRFINDLALAGSGEAAALLEAGIRFRIDVLYCRRSVHPVAAYGASAC